MDARVRAETREQKHISTGAIDTSRMFPTINKHRRLLSVLRDVKYCVINTHSSKILILINRCMPLSGKSKYFAALSLR